VTCMTTLQAIILEHLPRPYHNGITAWDLWCRVLNDWGSLAIETLYRNVSKLRAAGLVEKYRVPEDEHDADGENRNNIWRFRTTANYNGIDLAQEA
jgi:Fe2+ or Zn2+ uptake regulation protein